MYTWESITGPGTIDDLVADARTAGYPDVTVRRIHDWIAKGLLDQPRLRTRRRGSDKAEHSATQRRLLLLLLDKRQQVQHLSALAQVPLAMWLWWDGYVPTRQAQRAWTTWVGRGRRSQEVAREGALGLLEQVGHQLATPTARARFVRIITELGNGKPLTVRGRAELLDAVRDVMEPDTVFAASGLARALGPSQTPMTAETVVGHVEALSIALSRTLDGTVDAALLERARQSTVLPWPTTSPSAGPSLPRPDIWPTSSASPRSRSSSTRPGDSSCSSWAWNWSIAGPRRGVPAAQSRSDGGLRAGRSGPPRAVGVAGRTAVGHRREPCLQGPAFRSGITCPAISVGQFLGRES